MAKGLTRWQKADMNFREQVIVFRTRTGMRYDEIAQQCCVSRSTLCNYMNTPSKMTRKFERYLTMLFEAHGMRYDPTLGEGVGA